MDAIYFSSQSVEDLSERQDCLRSDLLNTQEKLVTANDIISSQDSDLHKLRQQKDQIDLNLQSCIRERDEVYFSHSFSLLDMKNSCVVLDVETKIFFSNLSNIFRPIRLSSVY